MSTISRLKIRANRLNGPLSRGPVSPEGKRRAAESNLSHGMYSARLLLPDESPQDLADLIQAYVDALRPDSAAALDHVRRIALLSWRIRRIERLTDAMLSPGSPQYRPLMEWAHSGLRFAELDPFSAAAVVKFSILESHFLTLQSAFQRSLNRFLTPPKSRRASRPGATANFADRSHLSFSL